ncbi:hypothetical protein [Rhodopila sp.]|uniref:hypothetical protein n=1 Tax=Rhodopila sp. TaxID=2480087 RepID=UPI003D1228CD
MKQAAEAQPPEGKLVKFNPELNVGTLVTVSAVLCSLVAWIVTGNNRSEQSTRDLATVQTTVSSQIADLRTVVSSGLQDVRQQISTLPDQRAKLEQVERRLADLDAKLNTEDQQMAALERSTIECRADINTLLRAANGPLVPGRSSR